VWTSAAAGASLLLALGGGTWDGRVQLTAEVRAGEAPLAVSQEPRAGVGGLVMPGALLRWLAPDLKWEVGYSARLFYRQPNEVGQDRPLLLHTGRALLGASLSRHWQLTGLAQASVGEADYTSLPSIFVGPQGTLPNVVDIFVLTAGLGLVGDPGERWHFEIAGDAERRDTLGDSPAASMAPANGAILTLPQQSMVRGTTSLGMRPTRVDLVGLGLVAGYAKYDSYPVVGVSLFTVAPEAFWRTFVSRQTEIRTAAGISISHRAGQPLTPVAAQEPWTIGPTFTALVNSHWARFEGQRLDISGGIRGESFLDPVLAVVTPRVVAELQVWWRAPPHWEAGVNGSFLTSMRSQPLPTNPDETAFYVTFPVRYRVSPYWAWEWGLRWGDRAPHWNAPDFAFHQRQLWFYVSILGESPNLFE